MRILIYKGAGVLSHYFKAENLDKIKQFCYNEGIKWYVLTYSDKENMEYEQLSKRNN